MTVSTTPVVGRTYDLGGPVLGPRGRHRAEHEPEGPEAERHERQEADQGGETTLHDGSASSMAPPAGGTARADRQSGGASRPVPSRPRTPAARPLTKSKTSWLQVSIRS